LRNLSGASRRGVPAAVLLAALLAGACGKKGDPLPPLSSRPARTTDLAVAQQEETAEVTFTFPSLRADGEPLRDLERIEIYRVENPSAAWAAAPSSGGARSDRAPIGAERRRAEAARRHEAEMLSSAKKIASLDSATLPENTRGGEIVYRDAIGAFLASTPIPRLGYAVVTVRRNRERSEISNVAILAPVAPPAAPANLFAQAEEKRICLSWRAPETDVAGHPVEIAGYRVYRRMLAQEDFGKPVNGEPVPDPEFADTSASYGATYVYTVTAVPKDHADSEGHPAISFGIEYRDTFPPPAVARLDAFAEEHVVRLLWTPVEAADLAGYTVYRSENGNPEVKIGETGPAADTAYEDRAVAPESTYRYVVRAFDRTGNFGAPSPAAEAKPFREE